MRLTSFARTLALTTSSEAIQTALARGLRIDKDADPIEGPRTALPYEDAVAVAEEDVSLLSVHLSPGDLAAIAAEGVAVVAGAPGPLGTAVCR